MTRIDAHFVAAGKYHDIDFARLELLKLLAEHPEIRTTVANDYSDVARIAQCRFLVTYTCDLMPTPGEAAAIRTFLENGGRWLALHGTNSILRFTDAGVDSPEERPDVMEMLGSQYKAHPPIGAPCRVTVNNHAHFLRQAKGRSQAGHILDGRFCLATPLGISAPHHPETLPHRPARLIYRHRHPRSHARG